MGHWKDIAMELNDDKKDSSLASILGITSDELSQLVYEIESDTGNDDMVYGYRVEFSDSSPKNILSKIKRLEDGCRVNLDLWELEGGNEE
ncbi:hypothetical protein J7E24_14350 [Hymenobacter sp. ISL-91]|uniref:hypothetical protein n=1 Tax=Hymenobacter sp. ISL-91 TaxID=2819151 RepID=UPI001BE72C0A|nr:hypothetical protein [Hymenobacter sp. ISL-91]MBT2558972.1 hypothetical protein [Hymenobacter sp. ISL-91]